MAGIGTLREQPLHAALKEWYREPGDRLEVDVEGFVVDVVRGDELIEIQTRGFSALGRKLDRLLDLYPVRLVHPVAAEKWITRVDGDGVPISRRRSPKRGIVADACAELVAFPTLLSHPHFTLEVLLTREEEVRRPDPAASWRRGWAAERRLVEVVARMPLRAPVDLVALLPAGLPVLFTTADLAVGLGRPRHLAAKVAYCLREAGVLEATRRSRAGVEYRLARVSGDR